MTRRAQKHRVAPSPASKIVPGAMTCEKALSGQRESNFDGLDDFSIAELISFFRLLDKWDRETKQKC
jgi:hypothetical protein